MSGLPYKRQTRAERDEEFKVNLARVMKEGDDYHARQKVKEVRPDYHAKRAKLVRATDEQWEAWQRAANTCTGGNLNAFMVQAADKDCTMPGYKRKARTAK
jgi:hypothetical protein